ncbi:Transposable element Tcb2 transposase [Pseudolycoriella hygida]|uniref:Transposable element Tcb2 transposase n=1 Tax=Pseudolycoriella hygida TaxID=35572 RepID=A0A9Q0S7W3_9DIPT|nr:Transposable element Tcb2 transposase [Pseudolycoriella hygida]
MERPNRQKHLSLSQRGAIIGQHMGGLSNGAIAKSLNVSRATVSKWTNRYAAEHTLDRRPQPGQVRKLDEIDMNAVAEKVLDTPFINAAIVGREYGVHRDTVRKVWNDIGIFSRIAARKTRLTAAQKVERVEYAEQHLHSDWSNVIFSDEKTFRSDNLGSTIVYRPINTRYDERYTQPTQRSGRICAGVWGWISKHGPGELSMISGRLNSVGYVELLQENLLPTINISYGGLQNIVFMQDNCSIHTSRYTQGWFAGHPELELIDAPSNSPDLNPIENVWSKTVAGWTTLFPRTRQRLEEVIFGRWEALRNEPEYFEKLYLSMPHRLQEVIDRDGAITKY